MGYVTIPTTVDQPLDLIINPQGDEMRSTKHVWNKGDQRTKLISLAPIVLPSAMPSASQDEQDAHDSFSSRNDSSSSTDESAQPVIATTTNQKAAMR